MASDGRRSGNGLVKGGTRGLWLLGFIGALAYYLHTHAGTFWLVLIAIMKAVVWSAFLVYHVLSL